MEPDPGGAMGGGQGRSRRAAPGGWGGRWGRWLALMLGGGAIAVLGPVMGTPAALAVSPGNGGQMQGTIQGILAVILLIAINAFFVTAEFALVSVRRSRVNQLVDEGDLAARSVQQLQRNIERLLSTTQLGITLSSLALGWIGERAIALPLATWLSARAIGTPLAEPELTRGLSIGIAFLLVAYLQIVLGELCPKSVALLHAEHLARLLGPPSLAISQIFHPFAWILNRSTRFLLGLLGVRYTGQNWYSRVTPEELQLIISTATESTGLEAEERELLNNVFEFGDVTAGEVMVPRTSIAAVPKTARFADVLAEVASSGHSIYPVTGESLDDICGMVRVMELIEALAEGQLTEQSDITPWIRPAKFVPEYTPLDELLRLMQRMHRSMVMVVDEFGGTAGLVTLENVVVELIGDLPSDEEEDVLLETLDDRTFRVQAQVDLEAVNELLGVDLPLGDDYQTLGGFLIYQLQKIPAVGECLTYRDWEFTVVSTDGPRLERVRIQRLDNGDGAADEMDSLRAIAAMAEEVEDDRLSPLDTDLQLEAIEALTEDDRIDQIDQIDQTDPIDRIDQTGQTAPMDQGGPGDDRDRAADPSPPGPTDHP